MNKTYIESRAKDLLKIHSFEWAEHCLNLAAGIPVTMDRNGNVTVLPRINKKQQRREKREAKWERKETARA